MEYRGFELIHDRELKYEHGAFHNLVALSEWDYPIYALQIKISWKIPKRCLSCSKNSITTLLTKDD